MRCRWIGLALGALAIVGGSDARADEVGCCEVECHSSDGSGRSLHSVQRRDMTQTECEGRYPGCETTWVPGACDATGERGWRMHRYDGDE